MPVPTGYTEEELAQYMHDELGQFITSQLAYTVPGSYQNPVIKTLMGMGFADISEMQSSDVPKLLAVAKVMALRAAITHAAGKYDFMTDSQSFRRDQVFKHLKEALALAESDAYSEGADMGGWVVESIPITDPHDPYSHIPDEFRVVP